MYTSLERNRLYRIKEDIVEYTEREFPEDHPPLFTFTDISTGERMSFMIEQLTVLEREGDLEYIGVGLG